MLRRIHKELGVANEIARARLALEREKLAMDHPSWYKAGGKLPRHTTKVEFGVAAVEDWNEKYRGMNSNATDERQGP